MGLERSLYIIEDYLLPFILILVLSSLINKQMALLLINLPNYIDHLYLYIHNS
jgi:hypothetical protein